MSTDPSYYVPASSKLPLAMAFGLLLFVLGSGYTINNLGNEDSNAHWLLFTSFAIIWGTMFLWFGSVIKENDSGMYSDQLNQSFVWGMAWFIFSEVMFFFCILSSTRICETFCSSMAGWRG
jgi:cytochrome c oxidase subunit 3